MDQPPARHCYRWRRKETWCVSQAVPVGARCCDSVPNQLWLATLSLLPFLPGGHRSVSVPMSISFLCSSACLQAFASLGTLTRLQFPCSSLQVHWLLLPCSSSSMVSPGFVTFRYHHFNRF